MSGRLLRHESVKKPASRESVRRERRLSVKSVKDLRSSEDRAR